MRSRLIHICTGTLAFLRLIRALIALISLVVVVVVVAAAATTTATTTTTTATTTTATTTTTTTALVRTNKAKGFAQSIGALSTHITHVENMGARSRRDLGWACHPLWCLLHLPAFASLPALACGMIATLTALVAVVAGQSVVPIALVAEPHVTFAFVTIAAFGAADRF